MEEIIARLKNMRARNDAELQSENAKKMSVSARQWLIEEHYIAGILLDAFEKGGVQKDD